MERHRKSPLPLGEAIRAAYQGRLTQAQLAGIVGVEQSTVSKWSRGTARPTLEQIRDLESACGRPVGFVLRAAGFCQDARSVPEAIDADAALTDATRAVLHRAYEGALEAGRP